jgi:hypothetical protein
MAEPVSLHQTTFTVNAGGGIEVPVTENWGLRTDVRWFKRTRGGCRGLLASLLRRDDSRRTLTMVLQPARGIPRVAVATM